MTLKIRDRGLKRPLAAALLAVVVIGAGLIGGTRSIRQSRERQRESQSLPDKDAGLRRQIPCQIRCPIHDAAHVRNAISRFNQVEGVTDGERDEAWRRIKHAASKFNVEMSESSWRELPHSGKK